IMVIESDPRLVTHSSPSLFGRTAIAAGTSIPCPATTVVMSSPDEVAESEAQPVTITSTKHQKAAGRTVIPPLRRRFFDHRKPPPIRFSCTHLSVYLDALEQDLL